MLVYDHKLKIIKQRFLHFINVSSPLLIYLRGTYNIVYKNNILAFFRSKTRGSTLVSGQLFAFSFATHTGCSARGAYRSNKYMDIHKVGVHWNSTPLNTQWDYMIFTWEENVRYRWCQGAAFWCDVMCTVIHTLQEIC